MLAQVSIMPVGTGEETKELTAKTLKIIEKSELTYQLTAMGTIIEGEWDEVLFLIKKCYEEVKRFADRVVVNVVIDDRKEMSDRLRGAVLDVEYAVGGELNTHGLT
ncbi:MTH1187 family thiamine-binding protein [bacterium]|nr:MTH1187 family thiamine-binding protein [bacterium]